MGICLPDTLFGLLPAWSLIAELLQEFKMLRYAVVFAIIAVIASLLGFSGAAGTSANIAYLFAVIFLVLFVVSLLFGRRAPGGGV